MSSQYWYACVLIQNDFTAEGLTPYTRFASVEYDATDEMVRIIEFDELNVPGRINSFKQEEIYHVKEVWPRIAGKHAVYYIINHWHDVPWL